MPELNDDKSRFYDHSWESWSDMIRYSPAPRIRREKILSWISDNTFETLLDIGCGNGEFLRQVLPLAPHVKLVGADISGSVIMENRRSMPQAEFHILNLDEASLVCKYDVVVCMEVIEHCSDYRLAIGRLAQMTGKRLFITVPCGPIFEIDRRVGHVQHFGSAQIVDALESAGLEVVRVRQWGFPFFNLYKHLINIRPEAITSSFLSSEKYGAKQKALALCAYYSFKLCLPWGGYQMFVEASARD